MTSFFEALEQGKKEIGTFNAIVAKAVDLLKQIENQRDGVLRDTHAKIFAKAKKELVGKTILISDPTQRFDRKKIKIIDVVESGIGGCFFSIIYEDLANPGSAPLSGSFTFQTSYQEFAE
jgi:hypothetical protein